MRRTRHSETRKTCAPGPRPPPAARTDPTRRALATQCGWHIQEFVHQEQDPDITRFILMRGKSRAVHRTPIPGDHDYHHHVEDKEALRRGEHPWSKLEAKDLPLRML